MSVTRQRNYKRVTLQWCPSPARSAPAFHFLAFVSFDATGNSLALAAAFGRRRETYERFRSKLPGLCPVADRFVASRQRNREFGHVSEEDAGRVGWTRRRSDELRCLPRLSARVVQCRNRPLRFATAACR